MYAAKEAREKAGQSVSEETKEQLALAEKCINLAVGKGEMSCWFSRPLRKQAIKKLEELGYKVVCRTNQRDGEQYEISW